MNIPELRAFSDELAAIEQIVAGHKKKLVRESAIRDRITEVARSWMLSVKPVVFPYLKDRNEIYKIEAGLAALSALTLKQKSTALYRIRLRQIRALVGSVDLYVLLIENDDTTRHSVSSQQVKLDGIPDVPLSLVPNSLIGWKSGLEKFVEKHPFDQSVFIMVRYRKKNKDLIETVKRSIEKGGYYGVIAADHNLTDDLYNPVACLLCCSRGIAIFDEPEDDQTFNPNVAYELGMMHLLGRKCLILKHVSLNVLHTDILMKLYKEYDSEVTASDEIRQWIGQQYHD